jgi:predicted kinase
MKNIAIIIRGPSGIGKSTVASLVHEKIENSANIDIDVIKRMISFDSTKERTEIAHAVTRSFVKELIDKNFNIIIEEIFRDDHYEKIIKILDESHYNHYTFFLTAPLELLIQRDAQRENKIKGSETITRLYKEIQPRENEIVLDVASLSTQEIVDVMLSKIDVN